jgi:anti-anti-sigma factor
MSNGVVRRPTSGVTQRVAKSQTPPVLEYSVPSKTGSTVTVALRGDMTGEEWTQRMRAFLDEQYVADGVGLIALDLSQVEAIDLDGIGALVALARSSQERSKRLVILGPTPSVEERLRRTGMLAFLTSAA